MAVQAYTCRGLLFLERMATSSTRIPATKASPRLLSKLGKSSTFRSSHTAGTAFCVRKRIIILTCYIPIRYVQQLSELYGGRVHLADFPCFIVLQRGSKIGASKEPDPVAVGDWNDAIGKRPLNKFIYMAEPAVIDEVRPLVEERLGDIGDFTQAQSNMLEVLPPNASKGNGVRRLLKSLDIPLEHVLAIGDAENVCSQSASFDRHWTDKM